MLLRITHGEHILPPHHSIDLGLDEGALLAVDVFYTFHVAEAELIWSDAHDWSVLLTQAVDGYCTATAEYL